MGPTTGLRGGGAPVGGARPDAAGGRPVAARRAVGTTGPFGAGQEAFTGSEVVVIGTGGAEHPGLVRQGEVELMFEDSHGFGDREWSVGP